MSKLIFKGAGDFVINGIGDDAREALVANLKAQDEAFKASLEAMFKTPPRVQTAAEPSPVVLKPAKPMTETERRVLAASRNWIV